MILLLWVVFIVCCTECLGVTNLVDYNALESFYNSTNGTNWVYPLFTLSIPWNFTGGPDVQNPCADRWQGVTCDADNSDDCASSGIVCNVIKLNLSNYELSGTVPLALSNFSDMRDILLSENLLYGPLPDIITTISTLEYLDISDNSLSGPLPGAYNDLLRTLLLKRNWFTGSVPPAVYSLNLTDFSVRENQLDSMSIDSLPPAWPRIERFDVAFNKIRGTLPQSVFCSWPTMLTLDLSQNYLASDQLSDCYCELPVLAQLLLFLNDIAGTIPPCFTNTPNIHLLDVGFNKLTGPLPPLYSSTLRSMTFSLNSLTGTIPTAVGEATDLRTLILQYNSLTSTLPSEIGRISDLSALIVDANKLSGTLPSELGQLTGLGLMLLTSNSFVGSIPMSYYNNLQKMVDFRASDNFLTGSVPANVSNWQLARVYDVTNNHMTGSMPASLGNMKLLRYLLLYENLFTGTIPTELGQLRDTAYLKLDTNLLEGTIPPALGLLRSAVEITLYSNSLTSTIPNVFTQMPLLVNLQLQLNVLEGQPGQLFSNWSAFPNLEMIDLSNNEFTGTIPYELFSLPVVNNIGCASNCFQGQLTSEICNAPGLEVLNLNGLDSSASCRVTITSLLPYAYIGRHYIHGSIPSCVWGLSKLNTLGLSGNSLRGELTGTEVISAATCSLTNMSLSFNRLSGVIPAELQLLRTWRDLHLENNRFRGNIDDMEGLFDNQHCSDGQCNITLNLISNRLSGRIPPSFTDAQGLQILAGNLFQCQQSNIPHNDPKKSGYICGSLSLDASLVAWGALAGLVIALVLAYLGWELYAGQQQQHKDEEGRVGAAEGSVELDTTASPMVAALMQAAGDAGPSTPAGAGTSASIRPSASYRGTLSPAGGTLFAKAAHMRSSISAWLEVADAPDSAPRLAKTSESEESCVSSSASSATKGGASMSVGSTSTAQQFLADHEQFLPELSRYLALLRHIRLTVCLLLGILLLFNAPLYSIVKTNDNWSTHQFQYQWYVSAALMQGTVPAALTCVSWFVVCFTLLYMMLVLKGSTKARAAADVSMDTIAGPSSPRSRGSTSSFRSMKGGGKSVVAVPLGTTALNSGGSEGGSGSGSAAGRSESDSASDSLSSRGSGMDGSSHLALSRRYQSEKELEEAVVAPPSRSVLKKYCYLLVAGLINAAIVLSAKGVYLYVVLSGSSSYLVTIVAEMMLAVFDLVWNWTVVTAYLNFLATIVAFTPNSLILVKVFAFMFNSVAAPCLVAAFSDPDCIRELFLPPQSISTTYTYPYCYTLDVSYTGACPITKEATVFTTYVPPFVYNFQCGSAMLTDYIPVFMFVYIFITFVMPTCYMLVLYLGPQWLHPAVVRVMPGLFWPGIADKVDIVCKRSNGECVYDLSPRLCSSISKPDAVVSSLMHHFVVLTTFGVASPPLALCIAVSMVTIVFFWQTLLGRYIQVCIELNHLDELAILEQEVAGAWKGSRSSARMLIVGSSLFYGFFFYDITCAELGWSYAIIFPIVVIGVPLLVFTLMGTKRVRDKYVGTYHLPIIGDFVIAEDEPVEGTAGADVKADAAADDVGLKRSNTVTVENPFTRTNTWNPMRRSSADTAFTNLFTRTATTTTNTATGLRPARDSSIDNDM